MFRLIKTDISMKKVWYNVEKMFIRSLWTSF